MARDLLAPVSRRERPVKPALTRQGIVETALKIFHAEGLGKVTMRRIATALDTGAASLYVYVRDTGDLHAQILDALLGTIIKGRTRGTWRERLKRTLGRYMALLLAHPEMARMAISTLPSGPNYLSLVDQLLGLLNEGGVPDREAAWAVDLLLLHATAHAAEKSAWKASERIADSFAAITHAIRSADPRTHPHVARLGEEMLSGGPGRAQWQLDLLLNGALQTPRPDPDKKRTPRRRPR